VTDISHFQAALLFARADTDSSKLIAVAPIIPPGAKGLIVALVAALPGIDGGSSTRRGHRCRSEGQQLQGLSKMLLLLLLLMMMLTII
jgi:hypothetical protein